jgi:Caspase domain
MTSRLLSLSLLIWLTLVPSVGSASAERRVALIIGNSNYKNVQLLANPARDATAVGALFKKAGFEVVESKLDLGNTAMRRTIREFTSTACCWRTNWKNAARDR